METRSIEYIPSIFTFPHFSDIVPVMRRVFIADAHLRSPTDENYRLLLRFLSELKGNTDELIILGDLFEFWVGYPETLFPHYRPALDSLMALKSAGAGIVYFEGNHDFHLGSYFRENLGASVHAGPAVLMLDGKRVYVCHGDQINKRDLGYMVLRNLLHNRVSGRIFPYLPPSLVFRVAKHLSRHSKGMHGKRNAAWNYESLLEDFAASKFRNRCDVVITAHFHRPFILTGKGDKNGTLLSVGDWITQYSYGEMNAGEISLHNYR